jgi:uncharacterized damage-inducible protein DinB
MIQTSDIRRWYDFAHWANNLMFDACESIDPDALQHATGSSFGSIIGTLDHLYGADWLWLERWLGRTPNRFPAGGVHTTIPQFRQAWRVLETQRDAWISSLTDDALVAHFAYRNIKGETYSYTLGELLFHVSNHATYHRGQIMQSVKQFGGSVTSSDYLYWLRDET